LAASLGGVDEAGTRLLFCPRPEHALLHQFVRLVITAGTSVLNGIDMLQLDIPEGQEMARALEAFRQAAETSKQIARYLNA
jgi:hypothetical protein